MEFINFKVRASLPERLDSSSRNLKARGSLLIGRSKESARLTLLWPGISSPTRSTIDTNFFRKQSLKALRSLKRKNRPSSSARTPRFQWMTLDFCGLIFREHQSPLPWGKVKKVGPHPRGKNPRLRPGENRSVNPVTAVERRLRALPDLYEAHLEVFYSGNDFCSPSVLVWMRC